MAARAQVLAGSGADRQCLGRPPSNLLVCENGSLFLLSRCSLSGGFLAGSQFQPERAAFSRLRLKAHLGAHPLGSFLDDGQANPGSIVLFAEALEDAKDLLMGFRGN